jgi:hypothetical protein
MGGTGGETAISSGGCCRLSLGDRSGFEADGAACARLGTERRFWFLRWTAALWAGTVALLDGRFTEVEYLAAAAREIARFRGEEFYLRQMFRLHVDRGNQVAALDLTDHMDLENPIHRSMRLFALFEQEGLEARRSDVESFVTEGLGPMTTECVPVTLSYRAEIAVALGDSRCTEPLYDEVLPYRGQLVIGGLGEGCSGAADRYLGMLASSAGRWDQSELHFKAALALEGGVRSEPLVARTRHWYGRMLLDSGRPEDATRARMMLAASLDSADALGMAGLARATRALLDPAVR